MKEVILLDHNENTKKLEEELKTQFVDRLLQIIGIETSEYYDVNSLNSSPAEKIKLKNLIINQNIEIIDYPGDDLIAYHNNDIIGIFKKPIFKLKRDASVRDKKKSLFLEMHVEFATAFDEDDTAADDETP